MLQGGLQVPKHPKEYIRAKRCVRPRQRRMLLVCSHLHRWDGCSPFYAGACEKEGRVRLKQDTQLCYRAYLHKLTSRSLPHQHGNIAVFASCSMWQACVHAPAPSDRRANACGRCFALLAVCYRACGTLHSLGLAASASVFSPMWDMLRCYTAVADVASAV